MLRLQGDSGGPLICKNHIFGVLASIAGCGKRRQLGYYLRVSYFNDWIRQMKKILLK